jgi:putative FmdB family regulatory protein
MPTYQYKCRECGIAFERFQHFGEQPLTVCPECDGPVYRVIQPVGVIFKGSGFYVTDHKGSAKNLLSKSDKEARSADGAPSAETTETKPATAEPVKPAKSEA